LFFTLKAATIAPTLMAMIPTAISNAQPTKRAKIGIPIRLLMNTYKKIPIKGMIRPRIAVIIVSF
jgi:hypothetical protein